MMEDTYYQLEEALVQGFQTPEEYQAYKELKEHYEEVTGDYSFPNENLLANWKSLFRIIEVWTLKNMKKRTIWNWFKN